MLWKRYQNFLKCEILKWENLCAECSDSAPSMLRAKIGFQTLVRNLLREVVSVHCMIHRQALALKTFPDPLHNVPKDVIKTVNYVKGGILNTRIF